MPNIISEDNIEQATVELLVKEHGYRHINCFTADSEDLNDGSGRESKTEVVFKNLLLEKLCEINPNIPVKEIVKALDKLTDKRKIMSAVSANKDIYQLIKNGINIEYENEQGQKENKRVQVLDFKNKDNNDFLAVTQLWIKGERNFRRPDIILYINGLPLVFIELKNSNVKLQNAYSDNLTNYKKDIPQLFKYNAFCVLSNAVETKVGSFTATWEFFFKWLRPDDEKEKVNKDSVKKDGTSLQRLIKGLAPKDRLLDYIENFILFHGDNVKIVAQNHQFIGVNKAIESFKDRKNLDGKLGVFWHTQGSGKSFSMIFLVQKINRKFTGNFSFVVVTDRDDLDGQIYRNFLNTGVVRENDTARPKDSKEMREFLSQNKRIVFTLIHKFRYDKGKTFPKLIDPKDTSREVVVIVDEAHRTQYKDLAENMRKGLAGAYFYAFTGTPLLGKDRKTHKWFGKYVSEYNFSQAMDDEATVPLFYKKRVPKVLIQNDNLSKEFLDIISDENLDPTQQEKLEREFSKEMEVIKRDDRLDTIAQDIVYHFPRRGYLGKGMVVSVDKFTSVKMLEKVNKYWKAEIKTLIGKRSKEKDSNKKEAINKMIDYMRSVDMAVVISEDAKEEELFSNQGINITPHRKILNSLDQNGHDIEYRFKDPADRLQLVFVCAMWLTGFDAPTVSTLYLDKPMKDHTLMQTIARANRVSSFTIDGKTKTNGEIVDYYNVFRNMKKALSAYALGSDDKEQPVEDKDNLFNLLDDAIVQAKEYCEGLDINLEEILGIDETFKNIELFNRFANIILERDERKREFFVYENTVTGLYEACKPEITSEKSRPLIYILQYLRGVIEGIVGNADIEKAKTRLSTLLDESVVTDDEDKKKFAITRGVEWNLANVDFDKLKEQFKAAEYKNIEIADLRAFIEKKLEELIKQNSTRKVFVQRLQEIIDKYNSGAMTTENAFDELIKFKESLKSEEERHIKENLSEEELELYDVLKKEKMTNTEEQQVKLAAQHLLKRLKEERPKVIVQDWYKDSVSIAKVKHAMTEVLDADLPESYDRTLFINKCDTVYELIYDYALKGEKWVA